MAIAIRFKASATLMTASVKEATNTPPSTMAGAAPTGVIAFAKSANPFCTLDAIASMFWSVFMVASVFGTG